MSSQDSTILEPAERLEQLLDAGDAAAVESFWRTLPSRDLARAVAHLDDDDQQRLLGLLDPDDAADLVDDLSITQAAELIEDMPAQQAAAIVNELDSDDQVDLLAELDDEDAQAILDHMDPEDAADVQRLAQYGPDTAGGLMVTEYLAFPDNLTVGDVLTQLREHVEEYAEYDAQYLYVVQHDTKRLRGVVKLRTLVLTPGRTPIAELIERDAKSVPVSADLDELDDFFDANAFFAAPVVDEQGHLVGVVRRAFVEEGLTDRADKTMLRFGGIVTGEELRTMDPLPRAARRLLFLVPTLLLTLLSVSVIAHFEPTIARVPALAIFLPMVAGLCGCAGNQAVAVSMREIALGLAKPGDGWRVLRKELAVGLMLGVVMGTLVFTVAMVLRGNWYLAAVVSGAIPLTICVAVAVGGTIPLLLKGLGVDPAMASGPLVTTTVDLTGFFTVLGIAATVIAHLT